MPSTERRTAYAYDDVFLTHDMPGHPERAKRLVAIMAELERSAILPRLLPLPVAPAPQATITRVHDAGYLEWLQGAAQDPPYHVDLNTYLSAGSYRAATAAVGAAVACVDAVLDGRAANAVALVRPPGHHATASRPHGFCLLNNVACAAAHALAERGLGRALIFDFDVHHGNGTQDAFYDDGCVLLISTHQMPLYPGTGYADERGRGNGYGCNANLPLPPGAGDLTYLACLERIVAPLAEAYQPQLVLVSAGYDGHWAEPLAHMMLTVQGYHGIAVRLLDLAARLCRGRIAFVLEGGYDLRVLPTCIANLFRLLLGEAEAISDPLGPPPAHPRDDLDHVASLAASLGLDRGAMER
jgi:acetoin utilization deacetylase AcuC-like enzyme